MKLVTGLFLFRFGLQKFTDEVNALLDAGYVLVDVSIVHRLLRTVAYAVLEKPAAE